MVILGALLVVAILAWVITRRLPSSRRDRARAAFVGRHCGRKIGHATVAAARRHAGELARKSGERFAVYRCEVCARWHVGHAKGDPR